MSNVATTIEQSKHLLELGLDPKTADMRYAYFSETDYGLEIANEFDDRLNKFFNAITVPAWSLSALLEVMPKGAELIKMENDAHELYYEIDYMFTGYEDSDPITAAYEMVCWLLEQGLIKKGGNDEKDFSDTDFACRVAGKLR